MAEVGEQIVGAYLKAIKNCDLVAYDIALTEKGNKGEIDVVGINIKKKQVFLCEVATHTQGLQYVVQKRPANLTKLVKKFEKDIAFAKKYYEGYKSTFMFWTPIVKITGKKAKYQAERDLKDLEKYLEDKHKIKIELIYNEKFLHCYEELKQYASKLNERVDNFPLRFLQIIGKLEQYLTHLKKRIRG